MSDFQVSLIKKELTSNFVNGEAKGGYARLAITQAHLFILALATRQLILGENRARNLIFCGSFWKPKGNRQIEVTYPNFR